jgi:hypothetical protein
VTIGLAAPANAVPEGWSDPDPVSWTNALFVLVVAPALLFGLIAFLTSVPHFVKRAKNEVGAGAPVDAPQLEAPREVAELDAPELQAPVPD